MKQPSNPSIFAAGIYLMAWVVGCEPFFWKTAERGTKVPKAAGWKKVEISNELGMKFVLIPAGTFIMGSPLNEPGRDSDEGQHAVTLTRPFYMQTTEVTQGQWQTVMGENPAHFRDCGETCPVEKVSWHDTQRFIARLNAMTP